MKKTLFFLSVLAFMQTSMFTFSQTKVDISSYTVNIDEKLDNQVHILDMLEYPDGVVYAVENNKDVDVTILIVVVDQEYNKKETTVYITAGNITKSDKIPMRAGDIKSIRIQAKEGLSTTATKSTKDIAAVNKLKIENPEMLGDLKIVDLKESADGIEIVINNPTSDDFTLSIDIYDTDYNTISVQLKAPAKKITKQKRIKVKTANIERVKIIDLARGIIADAPPEPKKPAKPAKPAKSGVNCDKTDQFSFVKDIERDNFDMVVCAIEKNQDFMYQKHDITFKYFDGAGNAVERDLMGLSAIHIASLYGHIDIVKYLVGLKKTQVAEISDNNNELPIHFAARSSKIDVLKFLIAQGSSIEAKNAVSMTPLFLAVNNGNANAVKFLAAAGANVDVKDPSTGNSALMNAAELNYVEVAKALLAAGASKKAKTGFMGGVTACTLASSKAMKELIGNAFTCV